MNRFLFATFCLALGSLTMTPSRCHALFHLWQIVEVYSNSNGSVQFIELVSMGSAETQALNAEIRTDSGKTFKLTENLTGDTLNDRLLFATSGFYALPGAPALSATQPNYVLPANFFNPANDRIRLFSPSFSEFHSRTINVTTPVPTDNVFSRVYSGETASIAANTPQARDTTAGSVHRGDYNRDGLVDAADYVLYRNTFSQAVTPSGNGADGSTNGVIDAADVTLWDARFGNVFAGAGGGGSEASGAPEPATVAFALTALFALTLRCRGVRRSGS